MKKKLLFFLMIVTILLSEQGILTLAGSVIGNDKVENMGIESPASPVHHCTVETGGSDYTDWSFVYFGSYPQTEVIEDMLTPTIINADYDSNGDAWINGIKYRRLSKAKSDYEGNFGDFEYRYFKWERIKWRVLKNDGKTLFVMADKGLDFKRYNEEYKPVTWENSTMRSWINSKFYKTAFANSEQEAIISQIVINNDNSEYGTEGGDNTQDKVYLLSIEEAENSEYGFCPEYDCYSASRWVKPTDYACLIGVNVSIQSGYEGNCKWWLRSPGKKADFAANVFDDGRITKDGFFVDLYLQSRYAVIPVMHIDFSSDLWLKSDDGGSGFGGEEVKDIPEQGNLQDNKDSSENNIKLGQGREEIPKTTSISGKIKADSKSLCIKWKKQMDITGYQIQYSTSKKFTKKTTKTKIVKNASKTALTVKKLKSNKKYYVRICTYKKANGKTYYSNWSKVKSVKTKK